MNSRTKLLRACCAALMVFAAGPAASAYLPVPFDEAALASMHSVGIVEGPEPDECNVYVYTSAFGGGSFRSDIESLSRIREFSPLVGVAQGGLQAGLAEALARTLGRERAASPALALRMLPRPASTRGLMQAAQAARATAGTDAVLAFFLRPGYAAVKPGAPFLPYLAARVMLVEARSGRVLYDEIVTVGQDPYFFEAAQALAEPPAAGAATLDALRAEPAQALRAWRAALQPIADHVARDLSAAGVGAPPPALPALPALPVVNADVPELKLGDKPLRKRLQAAPAADASAAVSGSVLVRLPAFTQPYAVRVAGGIELAASRWGVVVPVVTVLDDKLNVIRRIDPARATVRGGFVEQHVLVGSANAGEAYLAVQAASAPPLARWSHVQVTTNTVYGGTFTLENRRFLDLSGPLATSSAGPVELNAFAADGKLR